MLEASMMAGFAFNINGLGLCHQTAHQLSAHSEECTQVYLSAFKKIKKR